MKNPFLLLLGILLFLWLLLGSFLSSRYCNCSGGAAAAAPIVAPALADKGTAKSILIADGEKNFKAATNDNLLFAKNKCEYETPISDKLNTVFSEAAAHLKNNPQRILVLTGLYLGTEANECSEGKNLGFGRADKVKALLVGMGAPAAQIRTQSDSRDIPLFAGKVMGGVAYEFISGDVGEVEKRLRVGNMTLYFETNERDLTLDLEQQKYFEDLKYYLAQKPDAKIAVTGHTDNKGNEKYNLRLSRKRAEFVRDYMAANGIPSKHVVVQGLGPNQPIDTNDTDPGRAKNRRVEVKIQ